MNINISAIKDRLKVFVVDMKYFLIILGIVLIGIITLGGIKFAIPGKEEETASGGKEEDNYVKVSNPQKQQDADKAKEGRKALGNLQSPSKSSPKVPAGKSSGKPAAPRKPKSGSGASTKR